MNSGTGNDESVFGKDAMEELVNTGDISYNHLSAGTVINHLDFVYETLLGPRNYLDIFLSPLSLTWKSQRYQLSGLFRSSGDILQERYKDLIMELRCFSTYLSN